MDSNDRSRLTEQQRRAVETRGVSVILTSGAGCGKTHVLTERDLSHLRDDQAQVNEIVAITFTDRAAREMRSRIRQAVVANVRSAKSDSQVESWTKHLRNLESASISTFHSFCGSLLRQYAFDVGLDPRFEILEEVLAVNLKGEALDSAMQKLLTSAQPTGEDLRHLTLLYGWGPVVATIRSLMLERDESTWLTWLGQSTPTIVANRCKQARSNILPSQIRHLIATEPRIVRCLKLLRHNFSLPNKMVERVRTILDELPNLHQAADLQAAIGRIVEAARIVGVAKSKWPDQDLYEPFKDCARRLPRSVESRKARPIRGTGRGRG